MIIGFEKALGRGDLQSPDNRKYNAFLNQIKYFRARCNSSPAVKSANRFCGRNGAIPLPTVKVRMREMFKARYNNILQGQSITPQLSVGASLLPKRRKNYGNKTINQNSHRHRHGYADGSCRRFAVHRNFNSDYAELY